MESQRMHGNDTKLSIMHLFFFDQPQLCIYKSKTLLTDNISFQLFILSRSLNEFMDLYILNNIRKS